VDEATAGELRAAREEVEQTPEFQATKAIDDERFREQSFGACLGVVVISLVTVIVIAVVIGLAAHRNHRTARAPHSAIRSVPAVTTGSLDILTPLPVAAATLSEVLPAMVGPYRRVSQDQAITLSGTLNPLFHAVYSGNGETIHVYAVPASLPTPQQNEFRQGVALAAQIESSPTESFVTEHWHFAVVGPGHSAAGAAVSMDQFRQALGTLFRELSQ
jgi:hypothetical protein